MFPEFLTYTNLTKGLTSSIHGDGKTYAITVTGLLQRRRKKIAARVCSTPTRAATEQMPLFEAGCLFYFVHFAYWQFPVLPVLFYLVLSCLVLSCLVLSYSVLSSTVLSLGTKPLLFCIQPQLLAWLRRSATALHNLTTQLRGQRRAHSNCAGRLRDTTRLLPGALHR